MRDRYSLLVVDDEQLCREHVMRDIGWEKLGITVLYEAGSGRAAMELIRKSHPDIVILDIRMPGMDGLQVLEHMKAEKHGCQVIALSGYSDFEAVRKMLASGMVVDYLLKPASEDFMFEAVYKCVERIENKRYVSHLEETLNQVDVPALPDPEPEKLSGGKTLSPSRKANVISETKRYIQDHFAEKITLEKAAQNVFLTPSYLSRLFSEEGSSFSDCLIQIRVEEAKKLLQKRRFKVYEIAEMVGYNDVKYFMRVFRKLEGCTPSEYREKNLFRAYNG